MGEVFRARDTRLNRDVAIKVLPTHLAGDPLARARFEREAQAVAALSHRNILAVYDFALDGATPYVVTELLGGETLRERLRDGPLPTRKVVQIGADIAQGLAAAHDKGIVHRDVKPENVFVTPDGQVKILDFGLARQIDVIPAGETVAGRTAPARTDPGTVMGTVGYMSPEQVKGLDADHRSDIFSLGCVLYEAATGRRAFERETSAETMTAILREDPSQGATDSHAIPGALDQVVRHCLEKRREERFQSARDLAFALQSLSGSATSVAAGEFPAPGADRRRLLAIAGGIALTAISVAAYYQFVAGRAAAVGQQVLTFTQITDQPGVEAAPSLSPDGRTVVYARTSGADSALWIQRIGARTATRLSGPAPAADSQPAFSPDGERVAFRSERDGGGVFLMSASGESVTRLTDVGYSPTWSPDGRQIAISPVAFFTPSDLQRYSNAFFIVDVASGARREVAATGGLQPAWSPHGARIAFWGVHQGGQRDLWTVAADGSGSVQVTDDAAVDWSPEWSPDGRWIYFSSTRGGTMNLWRVPVDETSGRVLGAPEPVTTPSAWTGNFSFSGDGTRIAFETLDFRSTLFRIPFDAAREAVAGAAVPILKGTRPIRDHQLSPDGQWVAFTEAGAQEDLFVGRIDGSEYRRLTDDAFRDRGASWAPDGSRIAIYSDRGGVYDAWAIRPDGSGLTPLTEGFNVPGFPVWSPDGTRIAFGYGKNWQLVDATRSRNSLPAGQSPHTSAETFAPAGWSRSGDRIVGLSGFLGSVMKVMVYSIPAQRFSEVPGALAQAFWLWPVWLADGQRLIVRRPEGIFVIDAATGNGHLVLPIGGFMVGRSVGVSRDDRWITYTETATEGDVWMATLQPSGARAR